MTWVAIAVAILILIGLASAPASTGVAPSSQMPSTSLDLHCGFGPYDNDVRGIVHVAPPSTDPHC